MSSGLQVALKLGLSHVPLANVALDALEDWSSHIPPETMQPCYTTVLPLLDGYLKNTSTSCESDVTHLVSVISSASLTANLSHVLSTSAKDDNSWEVMSSVSSTKEKGHSRVLTRLMKKSNQLMTVCKRVRDVFKGFFLIGLSKSVHCYH